MEVIKAAFDSLLRAAFAEIKLNHVNLFGSKVVSIRAAQLAGNEEYIKKKNANDTKWLEKKKLEEFKKAWKESLSSFHTDEQKENIKNIFWRNLSKLFRGRVDVLPEDDIKEREKLQKDIQT